MDLVVLDKKDNKQIFKVQNPQKLLEVLELRKKKLAEKAEKLKKALPELKAMAKKDAVMPSVRYYEGKEGIWNIIEDLIASKSEAWLIVPGKVYDVFGVDRMMKNVIEKRRQIGKKAYMITDHHPVQIKMWRMNETNVREYRFVPQNIDLATTVYLYAGKVALMFWKEPLSGLIIENKELFCVSKFMFDSLWKELEGENLPPRHNEL